uniref:Uncharacterized protein n=1 Tax=Oryza meridionalis TaxID=40149 RepID=A0A0E0DC15_9ORYZ
MCILAIGRMLDVTLTPRDSNLWVPSANCCVLLPLSLEVRAIKHLSEEWSVS